MSLFDEFPGDVVFHDSPRPQRRSNGPAVAAAIVGLVAAIVAFVPIAGLAAWLLGPTALVLGLVGAIRGPAQRWLGLLGAALGLLALAVALTQTLAIVGESIAAGPERQPQVAAASPEGTPESDATPAAAGGTVEFRVALDDGALRNVTYTVRGRGSSDGESANAPVAPWSATVTVPAASPSGPQTLRVLALAEPSAAGLRCEILVDGRVVASERAAGGSTVACTASR